MQMEFVRKMPLPQELLRDYPIGEEMKRRKAARDGQIADILTGRDDRLLLIVGPCSADREDAVLDYMHRLSEIDAQVSGRLLIVPRVYTNKPRTKGVGYKGMLHQPDPDKGTRARTCWRASSPSASCTPASSGRRASAARTRCCTRPITAICLIS